MLYSQNALYHSISLFACYIAEYRLYSMLYSIVCMLYSTIPTPAGLAVYLAGRPTETRADTPASSASAPSSSRAPSQPPEGRDLDWEDYNYQQDPAAGGGQQGDLENPVAALLAGIPDFNTEELEALLATCQFRTIQVNLRV